MRNQEIAAKLNLRERTVRNYLHRIFDKLGISTRVENAGGHIDFLKLLKLYYTGDLAYCVGVYQATDMGITVDGRVLIVLRKANGKWLMAAHETVVHDRPD
jgi:ketosteroid isomerase-like protein